MARKKKVEVVKNPKKIVEIVTDDVCKAVKIDGNIAGDGCLVEE